MENFLAQSFDIFDIFAIKLHKTFDTFPESYIIFRAICVIYFVTLRAIALSRRRKRGRRSCARKNFSRVETKKKSEAAISVTSLNPGLLRPLYRREIKQLSHFAP